MSGPVGGLEVLFTVYTHVQGCLESHPPATRPKTFALSSLAVSGVNSMSWS